jgi:hypothetical protein
VSYTSFVNCPIAELLAALEHDGKPPLAWVVRFTHDHEDPVLAAWQIAWNASEMARLLEWACDPRAESARGLASVPALFSTTDTDRARADGIRRVIPVPPSLASLIALAHVRHGHMLLSGPALQLSNIVA